MFSPPGHVYKCSYKHNIVAQTCIAYQVKLVDTVYFPETL